MMVCYVSKFNRSDCVGELFDHGTFQSKPRNVCFIGSCQYACDTRVRIGIWCRISRKRCQGSWICVTSTLWWTSGNTNYCLTSISVQAICLKIQLLLCHCHSLPLALLNVPIHSLYSKLHWGNQSRHWVCITAAFATMRLLSVAGLSGFSGRVELWFELQPAVWVESVIKSFKLIKLSMCHTVLGADTGALGLIWKTNGSEAMWLR